jgi:GTP-binding protein
VLIHLVDVSSASGRDPLQDFETINEELRLFDPKLAAKPQIVAPNKIDALDDPDRLARLERHLQSAGVPLYPVSAVTGEGLEPLLEAVWQQVAAARDRAAAAAALDSHPE